MQKDFHYYCIAVLARAAGFNPKDALTIGYASQYVDDATESELIRLDIGDNDLKFDPVRTSYFGLESLHSVTWSAQKRVWIPFHFIPPEPFHPDQASNYSYITEPDAPLVRLVLKQAADEPLENRKRRLCRLGVALHTCADTWSHQDFSGRLNRDENDVESISIYNRGTERWEKLGIENVLFDALPHVGHAEAGYFPDLAFVRWKCIIGPGQRPVERDNIEEFLRAAQAIHAQLLVMEKTDGITPTPWGELEQDIRDLLAKEGKKPGYVNRFSIPAYRAFQALDVQKRCEAWQQQFRHLFEPAAPSLRLRSGEMAT